MKFYNLGLQTQGSRYYLEPISGSLVQTPVAHTNHKATHPEKLNKSLLLCHQPYGLNSQPVLPNPKPALATCLHNLSKRATRLIWLWRSNLFWLAHLYASFSKPCLEDSSVAIELFRQETAALPQNTLCLPRSLFAASSSRRFADTGVLFIGVFLPARSMHAWIIEDGRQPDFDDPMWVNFQPVAALC